MSYQLSRHFSNVMALKMVLYISTRAVSKSECKVYVRLGDEKSRLSVILDFVIFLFPVLGSLAIACVRF